MCLVLCNVAALKRAKQTKWLLFLLSSSFLLLVQIFTRLEDIHLWLLARLSLSLLQLLLLLLNLDDNPCKKQHNNVLPQSKV